MNYRRLGDAGVKLSEIGLGGWLTVGNAIDVDRARAVMDKAFDVGINFFDTANVYGWKKGEGWTEAIVGRWFAQGGGRREKTVIATKLYGDMPLAGRDVWPNNGKVSALNIRRALDASLKRLQTDYIDLYQMNHVDRATPWEEIWEAMSVLRQHGKIIYVGSSNFAGWHLAAAQEAARRQRVTGLVSEQSIYNLLVRDIELEVIPAAQHYGLGLIPWSPLQGGLLGGVLTKGDEGVRRLDSRAKDTLAKNRDAIEAYENLALELGVQPAELGLAWLLHQPAVTAPIIGPRIAEQLDGALKAAELELDQGVLDRLDELFPGHKTAPEDYAW